MTFSQRRTARIGTLLAFALLAGCSGAQREASKADAVVKNATSPIVGEWKIRGDAPPPKADLPQFVHLDFRNAGKLEASYVAAGGALASVINTPSKLKSEHDSYELSGDDRLSIIEGSRALDYTWAVRGGKLFLTGKGDTTATVYDPAG